MHIEAAGRNRIDVIGEPQELLMAVTPAAIADRDSRRHGQRREQGRNSVPFVAKPAVYEGFEKTVRLRHRCCATLPLERPRLFEAAVQVGKHIQP
ncbi:MAG TPA: hypothetical protein VFA54_10185 [Bryobacterales bacterium]|jgi:hypothetical protein|nr:hypothetical protein [Bryobacterales bacterium]